MTKKLSSPRVVKPSKLIILEVVNEKIFLHNRSGKASEKGNDKGKGKDAEKGKGKGKEKAKAAAVVAPAQDWNQKGKGRWWYPKATKWHKH